MSYMRESHAVKKVQKSDALSNATTGTNTTAQLTPILGSITSNFSDEFLCRIPGSVMISKNLLKGFFIFQSVGRLTSFPNNYTSIRIEPNFTKKTAAAVKAMHSCYSSIRDNNTALALEAYPSLATALAEEVDFSASVVTFAGASINKASGEPELWLLPIGENK